MTSELVVGLDLGSQGVRALVLSDRGEVVASERTGWPVGEHRTDRHEQDPNAWLAAVEEVLAGAVRPLSPATRGRIRAIAATSTSGTLVLTDADGHAIRPAIMWSDTRATREADEASAALHAFTANTGLRMRGSFPLPKLLWLREHEPSVLDSATHIMHAADFLLWHLGLHRSVTDPTNGLKSGYDITIGRWDPYLDELGLTDRLPEVTASGQALGTIDATLAGRLGVDPDVRIVGTMTDSNTATLAAGVVEPGQWLTTLGTGLSVKGISEKHLIDPTGSAYCHRDPRGYWLPSGTSHLGAAAVAQRFGTDLDDLTAQAETEPPGAMLVYPLVGTGDFFPRWAPRLRGFTVGNGSRAAQFRATLEGVAAVEELAYRRFAELGAFVGDEITSVGGASQSALWSTIRASVLQRSIRTVETPETAVGGGVLAFTGLGRELEHVVADVVHAGRSYEPDPRLVVAYAGFVERYEAELVAHEAAAS